MTSLSTIVAFAVPTETPACAGDRDGIAGDRGRPVPVRAGRGVRVSRSRARRTPHTYIN